MPPLSLYTQLKDFPLVNALNGSSVFFINKDGVDCAITKDDLISTLNITPGSGNSPLFNVKDYGALGDGVADDTVAIQAAIDSAIAIGGGIVYFPSGTYILTDAINLVEVKDIALLGAGRFSTKLLQTTVNTPVIQANGLWYSRFEGLRFETNVAQDQGLVELDGNYDGVHTQGVQANTFKDCLFVGNGLAKNCINMVRQGTGAGQGSENFFLNCHMNGVTEYCYVQYGFNALDNVFDGGDAQAYGKGVFAGVGSIHARGMSWECTKGYAQIANDGFDVDMSGGGVDDKVTITGCRSESLRVIRSSLNQTASAYGISHVPTVSDRIVKNYILDDIVNGETAAGNHKMYRCTTAGLTAGAAPVWPESGTVNDGTVVWTQVDFEVYKIPGGSIENATCVFGQITGDNFSKFSNIGFRRRDVIYDGSTYLIANNSPLMDRCYYYPISGGVREVLDKIRNQTTKLDKFYFNIGEAALASISGVGGATSEAIALYRGNNNNVFPILNWWDVIGGVRHVGLTFAEITTQGTTANGMLDGVEVFCTDGTPGDPLTGGGDGCKAYFSNNRWKGI